MIYLSLFFFSSRRRHTRSTRDWSSDVCSSDLLERDVEVDAQQHPLAPDVGLIECADRDHGARSGRQITLPMATAVSTMRFENPHSLSYQDITRTNVPSITLVWS